VSDAVITADDSMGVSMDEGRDPGALRWDGITILFHWLVALLVVGRRLGA
jgi:hypothetical protein